ALFAAGTRASRASGSWGDACATVAQLASLPGHEKMAVLELARVERRASGPEKSASVILAAKLDLTDPANQDALELLTDALLASGKNADALSRADAALAKHGDSAELQRLRGDVLARSGRDAEARAAFTRALELDPKLPGAEA